MGALRNGRHEVFAGKVVEGKSARGAYREAFPSACESTVKAEAWRLSKRPEIRARMAELRGVEAARMGHLTVDEKRTYAAQLLRGQIVEPAAVSMAKLRIMTYDSELSGDLAALKDGASPAGSSLDEEFRRLMTREPVLPAQS